MEWILRRNTRRSIVEHFWRIRRQTQHYLTEITTKHITFILDYYLFNRLLPLLPVYNGQGLFFEFYWTFKAQTLYLCVIGYSIGLDYWSTIFPSVAYNCYSTFALKLLLTWIQWVINFANFLVLRLHCNCWLLIVSNNCVFPQHSLLSCRTLFPCWNDLIVLVVAELWLFSLPVSDSNWLLIVPQTSQIDAWQAAGDMTCSWRECQPTRSSDV